MKKLILLFLFLNLFQASGFAQDKKIKKLLQEINSGQADTLSLKAYKKILDACELEDNPKYAAMGVSYVDSLIGITIDRKQKNNFLKYKATYLAYFSYYYTGKKNPNYTKAIDNEIRILKVKNEMGDRKATAKLFNTVGNYYFNSDNFNEAIRCHERAIQLQTNTKDYEEMSDSYFQLGSTYYRAGNAPEGYFNYYLALKIKNKLAEKKTTSKISTFESRFENFVEDKLSSTSFTAGIIGLIAGFLLSLGILHLFLFLFHTAGKSNLFYGLYALCSALAVLILLYNFCYPAAEITSFNSSFTHELLGSLAYLFLVFFLYSLFYPKPLKLIYVLILLLVAYLGCYKWSPGTASVAIFLFRIIVLIEMIRVVIVARKKKKEGASLFSFWMWASLFLFITIFITIAVIVEQVVVSSTLSISIGWIYFLAIIFCLTYLNFSIVMSVFLARQVAKTNKGLEKQIVENKELSEKMLQQEIEKKKILETQNEQLETMVHQRTSELLKQKEIVEEKQQEILDSISYAQRIQNALLPSFEEIRQVFPQSFVFFKPKDIVSGDFYWFAETEHKILIAAADCTGHGVPGAFMSTIGSEKLNEAANSMTDVSDILHWVNIRMKKVLHQSDNEDSTRDGMDIALIAFNKEMTTMEYAGANRPVWIIRKDSNEIEETKAEKVSIGGLTEDEQLFTKHILQLAKGDTIYISTDGYADQFSPEDKKLMTKRFKEMLLSINNKPMEEQRNYLDTFIENWKGTMEQTDDILVIGIKI